MKPFRHTVFNLIVPADNKLIRRELYFTSDASINSAQTSTVNIQNQKRCIPAISVTA